MPCSLRTLPDLPPTHPSPLTTRATYMGARNEDYGSFLCEGKVVEAKLKVPPFYPPLFFPRPPLQTPRGREGKGERGWSPPASFNYANPLFPLDFTSSRQMRRAHKPYSPRVTHTCDYIEEPRAAPFASAHMYVYEISVADRKPAKTRFYSSAVCWLHPSPPRLSLPHGSTILIVPPFLTLQPCLLT